MPLQPPNFFSIDDLLATQERTPCTFMQTVYELGNLNPSAEEQDLKPGTKLDLPLWLALGMTKGRQSVVTVELPKVYKEGYQEILKADPCAVNLHKFGFYFYDVGAYVKRFDARGDVADILLKTFAQRFRKVMDLSDTLIVDPKIIQNLDILEKELFKRAHKARCDLAEWLSVSVVRLEGEAAIVKNKKRKRSELDMV